ncbi:MAG: right-handed parallel beta-helix repeat-containing protein [Cyanobacteria bacterium TGS_CYA1]|nr:right-handed parallel beta-helix repeat-containing protein [Cyanobacteria bacterium TGS_CYA1]
MHNEHESSEAQQLALNSFSDLPGIQSTSDHDPFASVRLARADAAFNPFEYSPLKSTAAPFNLEMTNPYGPRYDNLYQDHQPQNDHEADGIEFSDGPIKPEGPQVERPEDRNRPIVTVRQGESIQRAIERAPEGAIIKVQAGVYNEKIKFTRDNIDLRGEPGAVMDFASVDASEGAIRIDGRKNITIAGFEIKNIRGKSTPTAIQVEGVSSNIRILNNDIHHVENNSNAHAISVYGRNKSPIQNIEIAGNKVHDLKLGRSEAVVINGNVAQFKITDNKIYNSNNIGIDIIGGEGVSAGNDRARDGLIARNEVSNVSSATNPGYNFKKAAAGIYVDGGMRITIENNRVQNSDYGIEIASERRGLNAEGITVRNNDLIRNQLAGISIGGGDSSNGGITDSVIENNRLVNNVRAIWRQKNVGAVDIKNNIVT